MMDTYLRVPYPLRLTLLIAVMLMLIAALNGCASTPQEWCDDNPRACRVVVVGGGVLAAACVAGVAVSLSHNSVAVHQNAATCTTCGGPSPTT